MGIVSAIIVLMFAYFLIPNGKNSSKILDEKKATEQGQKEDEQPGPEAFPEKFLAPLACLHFLTINLLEALQTLESEKVKDGNYEGACINSPGWPAIANSGNITDAKNGSHFIRVSFQPMNVGGRLYFMGETPKVKSGQHLLITGRINRLRAPTLGRNPRTGEKIKIPATVLVLGRAQIVPMIKEEYSKKVFLTEKVLRGRILESIAIIYKVPISSIKDQMNFDNDFPSDQQKQPWQIDLRIIELIMRIEKISHCEIEDDIAETVNTVSDLIMIAIPRCSIS